ncbi:hypothetical protein [Alicycliphilus denitrificans]|uniref:hypothetical protein n=1 Tax=Alicycliphilus denitrificans TaxID=179636 RepID=UPI000C9F2EF6|nr:hypothetical protein [Alicycliphilus denitrificans]
MPHSPISAGTQVTYKGEPYIVRAVDGSVLELAYHTGAFFRLVHASSVKVCLPPATSMAASLPAPAAGQGVGTRHHFLCLFFSPAGRLAKVHQSDCMFAPGALVSFGRRWPA